MKKLSYLAIVAASLMACTKNGNEPNPANQRTFAFETNPAATTISWKCIGGDTLFTDTLIFKLDSVWLDKKTKTEMQNYKFSYPVWHHNKFICSSEDAVAVQQISFSDEDCKSVCFKRIK